MTAITRLRDLAIAWGSTTANERASFQSWLIRFCEALGVEPPVPPTDDYRFELPVRVVDREGREATNFIDCWKAGHFALEAKASVAGKPDDALLRKAFGQLRNYVAHVPGDAPPYLMVLDVPRTLIVWDRWSGSYGDFAAGRRIALATLHERPEDVALLHDIWAQPAVRDPRGRAQAVTRQIAGGLAELAARLESRGLEHERVARFLMRCVFSCFAEDVGLLPAQLFRRTLETARASGDASHLARALTALWQAMDTGGMFGAELLHRFNGHFFKVVEALPLEAADVALLVDAAKHDWATVEPSIFGTLLVRALDPEERHRLGAEYTPRAYIERLVEPTVVEPIRERWTAVQAAVLQLEATGKKKDVTAAVIQLRDFHAWMRGLRFLDPACGSGNFLYVTMAAVKRVELEVLNEVDRLSGGQGGLVLDEVHPRQFFGIEVKPWAREIAELTLWIGYHQFWRASHGGRTPPDPILEDTGTIECRDAVLAWDAIVHRPERDRPDPTPRIVHPVTGELVPDPARKLPYYEYVGARQAEWPQADFIVGNPPYLGEKRQRAAYGDGYVDALRAAYPNVPANVDLVMYWWSRGALRAASGEVIRTGFITTNSIVQHTNRQQIEHAIRRGATLRWAVANHPWSFAGGDADVRVAMTVIDGNRLGAATLATSADDGTIAHSVCAQRLNADLTISADVASASAQPLLANSGLSHQGAKVGGKGFYLNAVEASELSLTPGAGRFVRRIVNGRDIAERDRDIWIVDFGLTDEAEARTAPVLFDRIRDRVWTERQANARESYRRYWWRFVEPRRALREALAGLTSYYVTPEVNRRRVFIRLEGEVVPDSKAICIASEDASIWGILSSTIHIAWATAAGGRLGVGNDPVYVKSACFDAFPFPIGAAPTRTALAALAERLDTHRKQAIARDERVTMTGMYNVVEKLRSGEPLTPKERAIHEIAACGVLRDLHDELDALVAAAYGWPWPMEKEEILERLVSLHDERVEEEKRGIVRWLRPEYQVPRFAPAAGTGAQAEASLATDTAAPAEAPRSPWPPTAVEQLTGIAALLAGRPHTVDDMTARFTGAQRALVERHLETLALMGEVVADGEQRYAVARKVA